VGCSTACSGGLADSSGAVCINPNISPAVDATSQEQDGRLSTRQRSVSGYANRTHRGARRSPPQPDWKSNSVRGLAHSSTRRPRRGQRVRTISHLSGSTATFARALQLLQPDRSCSRPCSAAYLSCRRSHQRTRRQRFVKSSSLMTWRFVTAPTPSARPCWLQARRPCFSILAIELTHSHSGAISVRKLHSCGFKRCSECRHSRIMGQQYSGLSLETFNCWK
jgi:hypothetical protein